MARYVRDRLGAVREVVWEAQTGPQSMMIACPCFEVFFGGARGGGKTDGMLGEWIRHSSTYGADAIGIMFRRRRTELLETMERSKALFPRLGAVWNEQDKMWRMPGGGRLRFAYLERDSDADSYQGHSYTRVYIEEVGTFPDPKPINKLKATLRSGAGVPCGMRLTGNPGGPGHLWVKSRYIDPAPQGLRVMTEQFTNPWTNETVERDRVFIPSKLHDNKYLGAQYVATLQMAGSAALVKAWLEGDWSIIDGAFFDCWESAKHVIRPFTIPADWTRFRSMDWGSAKPFSVGWWAVVGDDYTTTSGLVLPRGCLVRYREWYGSNGLPNVGLKLPAEAVGATIATKEARDGEIAYGVIDPAAFSSDGGPSIAERIMSGSGGKVVFRRADNARVGVRGAMAGWDLVRSRLIGDHDGRPMMVFFDTCVDTIRTLPVLQHDPDRPEDVDTEQEDHCGDCVRYACASRPYVRTVEKPVEPRGLFEGQAAGNVISTLSIRELIERQQRRRENAG